MFTKTLARVGPSPLGFLLLGIVTTLAALGTYFAAGRSEAKAPPRAAAPHQSLRVADAAQLSPVKEVRPPARRGRLRGGACLDQQRVR